ncbi:winged helix-turn-helix domain-containing protein [Microtetraspora malaysiensis]|uniref:Winged helix-turn-helix domain-containing protein n=1 Tax=Microtetraspora malaysiensis TaxID=161358 RepID=A0ABW6SMQ8_9ACTN
MSVNPAGDIDEQPVIFCVTSSPSKRARIAQLMGGTGTVLMFSDLNSVRQILCATEEKAASLHAAEMVALGRLVIDADLQQVSWAGRVLPLTRIEREVLTALASPPLRVWTYRQLYEQAWGAHYVDDASAVRSTVKRLRAKLRNADATVSVESMRGVGFSLVDTRR